MWKSGNVEVWQCGGLAIDVEVSGNVEVWKYKPGY